MIGLPFMPAFEFHHDTIAHAPHNWNAAEHIIYARQRLYRS
jgi:hypothetical protein